MDVEGTQKLINALREYGAIPEVLAPVGGRALTGGSGGELAVDRALVTMASVLYDAVVVPCGPDAITTLSGDGLAVHFVTEAYKHHKAVAAFGAGLDLLRKAGIPNRMAQDTDVLNDQGVVTTFTRPPPISVTSSSTNSYPPSPSIAAGERITDPVPA